MTSLVISSIDDRGVGFLTLNRPSHKNAFNEAMIQEITACLEDLHKMSHLRVLILRGEGTHFSAGADLEWMRKAASYSHEENLADARKLARMMEFLETLPCPTIAYAQGGAFGGALGLLACADIALSDPQTVFSLSEVKLGLIPAVISPYIIRAIGLRHALRIGLTGERFDGVRAHHMGLVHELVDSSQVETRLDYFTQQILHAGPEATRTTKTFLKTVAVSEPLGISEMTSQKIATVRVSDEAQAGLTAFFNKEPAPWMKK